MVAGFLKHLKLLDMRIHIGNSDNPIKIVVPVDVRLLRKPEVTAPAVEKAPPEEIAHRNAIRFFVAQSLVHPVELRETSRTTFHVMPLCVSRAEKKISFDRQNTSTIASLEWRRTVHAQNTRPTC